MEQTELFIDMQSYAVFVCKIYIISDFKLCYNERDIYCLFGRWCRMLYLHRFILSMKSWVKDLESSY